MITETNYTEVAKRLLEAFSKDSDLNVDPDFMSVEGFPKLCLIDVSMTYEQLGEYIKQAVNNEI